MSTSVFFDSSGFEFGNAISCGMLLPYNCKRYGFKVSSKSRMSLPSEWTDLWFDSFGKDSLPNGGYVLGDKKQMEKFVFVDNKMTDFEPIKLPALKRPIDSKYVVLIPTTTEMARGNPHKLELCMSTEAWVNIANFIRSKGMKVISFSSNESCQKEISDRIGDISFHAEKKDLKPNTFLKNQLIWMQHAETSVSFGGALHIAYSFDVPGIGFDGQMIRNYISITKSYSLKRTNFSITLSENNFARSNGYLDFKSNPEVAKRFYMAYSEIVINHIKERLNLN